jgi:hypothetical protein
MSLMVFSVMSLVINRAIFQEKLQRRNTAKITISSTEIAEAFL